MPIAFNRYVQITSGVGGGAAVPRRDLISRLFTTNDLVPTGGVLEFTDLADVLNYFGSTSEEYLRAQFYFGFVSKNITSPNRISYARWASVDTAPQVFGAPPAALDALQAITAGSMNVIIGGATLALTAIDLSSASSLADVASTIQTAVRTGTGTVFTAATVTYNAVGGRFDLVGGETGANTISITAGASSDVAGPLGWLTGAIVSNGVVAETVTETLTDSAQLTNNFGSFDFIAALTEDQKVEAATWTNAQNVMFMYLPDTLPADAASLSAAIRDIGGVGPTLKNVGDTDFPQMLPAAVLAATDYGARNSTQNYMFQQEDLTPTVTTSADANLYDGLRINYYGQTQTAGQDVEFYQRGVLMGTATDPVDMNTYANEIWFKDAMGAEIMSLLLSLPKVSANAGGRAQLMGVIQGVIETALLNGTISVDKILTTVQQLFITQVTGDPDAWQQVQTFGYWVDAVIRSDVVDGSTQFTAVYTLVYSKDDVIRKVEGRHILI